MSTKKPVVSVILEEDVYKKIEDYRFENRINSRSQALSDIIKLGLEQVEKKQKSSTR